MKHHLLIEIDCEDEMCGKCWLLQDGPHCRLFKELLKIKAPRVIPRDRLGECKAIEVEVITCPTCGGRGEYELETIVTEIKFTRTCAQCHGTGKVLVGPKVK